jgi:hypothetical protein
MVVPSPPSSVPLFTSLTAQQRTQLPDSTKVSMGKYVTTLGALRLQHRNRTLQISRANGFGLGAVQGVNHVMPVRVGIYTGNLGQQLAGHPVIEPAADYSQTALDMQNFCNAAKAAVCLYYPAETVLCQCGGWAENDDPYITDPSVCASQGGIMLTWACQYNYNTWYKIQFNPGSGFTYKANCDATYWKITTVDKHGAIQVDSAIPEGATFTTGSSPTSCVITAWVTS